MDMKFRCHQDPLYYDPKANDKIFVPMMDEDDMTDKQKELLATFPKTDRGMFGEEGSDDENASAAAMGNGETVEVEEDFVDAAAKKAKLKQKAMRERRKEREAAEGDEELAKKRVRFVNDEEEELGDSDL